MSIPARCTARSGGRRCTTPCRSTTRPALTALAERADLVVEGGVVAIDGHEVTTAIRTPEMDKAAAAVARLPRVRAALVARQRAMGAQGGVVMEGRDIGSVVFPDAPVKIYLDASAQERARRRANDSAHAGSHSGQAAVAAALAARDQSDSTRTASPLTVAKDAVVIDTTDMPIDVVVARVLALVRARLGPAELGASPLGVQRSSKSSDEAGSNSHRCRSRSSMRSAPSSSSLSS